MQQFISWLIALSVLAGFLQPAPVQIQTPDITAPAQPVKLIFIHHSTGGNWLADPANNELGGGLGRALMENNYYVSATNYGWGPDAIGDATDIPNWLDWFRGERSSVYTQALYNESGKNIGDFGDWPRLADDPGGENRIILFKSCFPNSELEGRPDDPPAAEGWLTVSNAKYVYNELLKYFATRPDKLFVIITAPPLSSSSNAKNARAFNLWLMNDWLAENDYPLNNVAVFDFYNVLTGPDNHHRVNNGQVEHTYTPGKDRLYYPSGDDHPSRAGNTKATEEFIPLLNAFYNQWITTAPAEPPQNAVEQEAATSAPAIQSESALLPAGGVLEDFENGAESWQSFTDESGGTQLTCHPDDQDAYQGNASLQMSYTIAPDGWATCARYFDQPQDWSTYAGLSYAIRAAAPGGTLHVDLYAGSPENQESYYFTVQTASLGADWSIMNIPWQEFKRVDWEENAGAAFTNTTRVLGLAFGYPGTTDPINTGVILIDDVRLMEAGSPVVEPQTHMDTETAITEEQPATESTRERERNINFPLCGGASMLPFALLFIGIMKKKTKAPL